MKEIEKLISELKAENKKMALELASNSLSEWRNVFYTGKVHANTETIIKLNKIILKH